MRRLIRDYFAIPALAILIVLALSAVAQENSNKSKDDSSKAENNEPSAEERGRELQEGLSGFERNYQKSMILEAGPQAVESAEKKKAEEEKRKEEMEKLRRQNMPIRFVPGVPDTNAPMSESGMRSRTGQLTETSYRAQTRQPSETPYRGNTRQPTETSYKPVMKSMPNTLNRRKPTITPTPIDKKDNASSSATPENANSQMVEIDGGDVIFARRPAKGGGE